ncbi:MAG: hypothetical protein JWO13_3129 [Acidobacteriales bacterium]|nr:hypothetical protein [Terriglobales bacterium]
MKTLFLAAQSNAMTGVARLFDWSGHFDSYNQSATPAEADARAIFSDWYMVGEDLRLGADGVVRKDDDR